MSRTAAFYSTRLYHLLHNPLHRQMIAPLRNFLDEDNFSSVIDIGCGPGTHTEAFLEKEYLGLDLDAERVEFAQQRHSKEFLEMDARDISLGKDRTFDIAFIHSLLHHIDDAGVKRLFETLPQYVKPEGSVHLFDLILPEEPSVARYLAKADRGDHPRPLEHWKLLLDEFFEIQELKLFNVQILGITCWKMFYSSLVFK